jgi:hypothetical protein
MIRQRCRNGSSSPSPGLTGTPEAYILTRRCTHSYPGCWDLASVFVMPWVGAALDVSGPPTRSSDPKLTMPCPESTTPWHLYTPCRVTVGTEPPGVQCPDSGATHNQCATTVIVAEPGLTGAAHACLSGTSGVRSPLSISTSRHQIIPSNFFSEGVIVHEPLVVLARGEHTVRPFAAKTTVKPS